jgi:hypothetical protein
MSKFKVNVKLSGYEVKLGSVEFSVEGEREDAQKISHEIEKQLSGMIHAPTVMTPTLITPSNGNSNQRALEGQLGGDDDRLVVVREVVLLLRALISLTTRRRMGRHNRVGRQCKRRSGFCMSSINKPMSLK